MKKTKILSLLLFTTIMLFIGCSEQENVQLEIGDGFIQFANTSSSITENSADGLNIEILYGGSVASNTSGIDISFIIEGADSGRFDITPANGKIRIPAGETSANITLETIDNNIVDGDLKFKIILTEESDKAVGIGGEGIRNHEHNVTIVDNDCPVDINGFVGTYTVSENFTAGVNAPLGLKDFFAESYQLELSLAPNDPSGTKLVVNNSIGFNTYIKNGTILAFDTCNNKITFDGNSRVQVALFRTFVYEDSSYDETNFVIKATGPLSTFGAYQFTFTKK